MGWAVVDYDETKHRKAYTIARKLGFNTVCSISDSTPAPALHGCIAVTGTTFVALRNDGAFAVLANAEIQALLQALAAAIP